MTITYAILGLLSQQALTGYDLKQRFQNSLTMYWSGSNNQIYRTLVKLKEGGLVTRETLDQKAGPSRKLYTITTAGEHALYEWLLTAPELPEIKHPLLIQLAWADRLTDEELDNLLQQYEQEVGLRLMMVREGTKRDIADHPPRTSREKLLWDHINANWEETYAHELRWVQSLRNRLKSL